MSMQNIPRDTITEEIIWCQRPDVIDVLGISNKRNREYLVYETVVTEFKEREVNRPVVRGSRV
jgi:hypothetical protein